MICPMMELHQVIKSFLRKNIQCKKVILIFDMTTQATQEDKFASPSAPVVEDSDAASAALTAPLEQTPMQAQAGTVHDFDDAQMLCNKCIIDQF